VLIASQAEGPAVHEVVSLAEDGYLVGVGDEQTPELGCALM